LKKIYRVADYISDFLVEKKIKHTFLLPGGGNMYLVDGVGKNKNIEVIPCLHEQAVSIAAEAYSRITENIGVGIITTGPGSTNAITGVAGSWIDSIPLMIISGQVKTDDMMKNNLIRQKGVQEVDIISMVKKITKFSQTVKRKEDIKIALEKAYYFAINGRPGPVWIDIPLDIQGAPIDKSKLKSWKNNASEVNKKIKKQEIKNILKLITQSKRPIILAGHGIRLSGKTNLFKKVINKLGIPVVTTWNAMDLLPYEHKLNIGRPGVVALRAPNFAVQNSDLLISIGSRLDNIITAFDEKNFARFAKKIIVDIDKNEIKKLNMKIDLAIHNDANLFLQSLLVIADKTKFNFLKWQKKCIEWKKKYTINDGKKFQKRSSINHYEFVELLSNQLPKNSIISTGSSGLGIEVFYSVFRNKIGQRIFLTSGLGAMGYGLPSAIGACFANYKKPMFLIEGDGSFQLNIQEMAVIAQFRLPICIIIMNNKGYASIRNTQQNYFNSRFVGTGKEGGLNLPNLEKLAEVYKISYFKISNKSEINLKFKKIFKEKWPVIIDVNLNFKETLSPKVSAIPLSNGSIVSMPLEDMSPLLNIKELKKEMLIGLSSKSITVRSSK
tara:strand:- start:272 stop:2101 length:1830 start_codon:yes stop_codon:yes gene_type:complete